MVHWTISSYLEFAMSALRYDADDHKLDDEGLQGLLLLAEQHLSEDWDTPEENEARAHLEELPTC
jgi:hypothetical protein